MAAAPSYSYITKNLYMGSKKVLKESGIDTNDPFFDIYVCTAKEVRPPRSVPGLFTTVWIKMDDFPWNFKKDLESVQNLVGAAGVIAAHVKRKHRVVIFCNMGMNRSGFMTALVLMHLGWSLDAALKKIRERHPCTISNNSFMRALRFIEQTYFGR